MEIKIQCGCGTKYAFEVEPVNNRMPAPVGCPNCGTDGTFAANEILARTFPTPVMAPAPAMAVSSPMSAAPTAVAAAPARLSISRAPEPAGGLALAEPVSAPAYG